MRSESDFLLAQFFRDRGFLRLQPPIITSSDCEGAGEVFSVSSRISAPARAHDVAQEAAKEDNFFRKPKFLTVSSQLHLEAYMQQHPKVWTFSPAFRAEKSDTPRHVSEFWMLEVEMRTQSLEEIMDVVEDMIKSLVQGLRWSSYLEEVMAAHDAQGQEEELDQIASRWENLAKGPWPRIRYNKAMELLQDSVSSGESDFIHEPNSAAGLQLEHEKYIAAKVGLGQPVFVTDYPQSIKPFYMLPSVGSNGQADDALRTAACFDLLLPEVCEVVGGSLREHRLQKLEASMLQQEMDQASMIKDATTEDNALTIPIAGASSLDWYIDLRRFGSVPHGGFGFGFDRLLCYLTCMRNIKDVVPWPRYYGRCDC